MTLSNLISLGFDRSANTFGRENLLSVACSQCESMVINGVPTHERGCPNTKHECAGCEALVPRGQKYCEDCK